MASAKTSPWTIFGLVCVLLTVVSAHSDDDRIVPLLFTSIIVVSLAWYIWHPTEDAFIRWIWTIAGIFYVGWMLRHLVGLRRLDEGRDWVLLVIFTTFAIDTVAYFVGRAFGRHHMAPKISPGKTWEGAAGGMIGGLASTIALAFILDLTPDPLNYPGVILLGLLIPIFSQLGDLA
jgi:phosphatidate cytidylyltransferase